MKQCIQNILLYSDIFLIFNRKILFKV